MRSLALLLLLLLVPCTFSTTTRAERAAEQAAQQELDASPRDGNLPSYHLSPQALQQGQTLQREWLRMHFAGELWQIAQVLLLLQTGLIARAQTAVKRLSANRWVQGYVFLLLFLLATTLLNLPLEIYAQRKQHTYGLSVQSWASWMGDLAKGLLLTWVIGGVIVMLLLLCIRRLPRAWWSAFWLASLPITVAGAFLMPYVVDPLFNTFEPLAYSQPQLVLRLEQVAQRGHMNIPPERMFLMRAANKVTTLNAYVSGFGASKRVVVWDTTFTKATPDEVLFIFGHESGHYVLHHIVRGILLSMLGLFALLYLHARALAWAISRFGVSWGISSQHDWGALAILLLVFSCISPFIEPISASLSRMQEHAADVYGQEAIHGIVADPAKTARDAFQVLGETSLDVPNPSQLLEFWTYSHPSIGRRAAFASHYEPWAEGMQPKYLQ